MDNSISPGSAAVSSLHSVMIYRDSMSSTRDEIGNVVFLSSCYFGEAIQFSKHRHTGGCWAFTNIQVAKISLL